MWNDTAYLGAMAWVACRRHCECWLVTWYWTFTRCLLNRTKKRELGMRQTAAGASFIFPPTSSKENTFSWSLPAIAMCVFEWQPHYRSMTSRKLSLHPARPMSPHLMMKRPLGWSDVCLLDLGRPLQLVNPRTFFDCGFWCDGLSI